MSISTHIGDAYVMATTSAQVQQLYVAYLGRAADQEGLDYWLNDLNSDPAVLTLEDLRSNFVNEQAEYTDVYGGLSRTDTVIKIYNNLFGRTPDTAGLTYWTTGDGAAISIDQLLVAFINGASASDAKVVANKVLVSEVYTSTAGADYTKADAISILDGVDGTATSVSVAVAKLEDGSLSGIAIPAGVGALKAADVAEKAQIAFEESKVDELVTLNKDLQALSSKLDVGSVPDLTAPADGEDQTYLNAKAAIENAKDLRNDISDLTTEELQTLVTKDAATVTKTSAAFKLADKGNVDLANTFEKAVAANAALSYADGTAVTTSTAKVQVDFTAANTGTALATANTAAGLTGEDAVTNAESLYAALTNGNNTAAENKAIVDAFTTFLGSSTDFTTLKGFAATDYAKAVAVDAESDAAQAVADTATEAATTYLNAVYTSLNDQTTLKNAQSADALLVKATAIEAGEKVVVDASTDATTAIPKYVLDAADAGTTGADLFHFADGVDTANDFAISFGAKDALYIGEGYTLNSAAKLNADGTLTGGANGSLEVFFIKDAGVVKAVIETSDLGSSTVATGSLTTGSDTDGVSVITLTGVTDIAQVTFANGVISHVA